MPLQTLASPPKRRSANLQNFLALDTGCGHVSKASSSLGSQAEGMFALKQLLRNVAPFVIDDPYCCFEKYGRSTRISIFSCLSFAALQTGWQLRVIGLKQGYRCLKRPFLSPISEDDGICSPPFLGFLPICCGSSAVKVYILRREGVPILNRRAACGPVHFLSFCGGPLFGPLQGILVHPEPICIPCSFPLSFPSLSQSFSTCSPRSLPVAHPPLVLPRFHRSLARHTARGREGVTEGGSRSWIQRWS